MKANSSNRSGFDYGIGDGFGTGNSGNGFGDGNGFGNGYGDGRGIGIGDGYGNGAWWDVQGPDALAGVAINREGVLNLPIRTAIALFSLK